MESHKNYCLECSEILRGRTDKKFCSDSCRAVFHNRQNTERSQALKIIDKRLKQNRRILMKLYNGLSNDAKMVPLKYVETLGFTFNYFTHIEENAEAQFIFCYDYGYHKIDNKKVRLLKQSAFSEGVDIIA